MFTSGGYIPELTVGRLRAEREFLVRETPVDALIAAGGAFLLSSLNSGGVVSLLRAGASAAVGSGTVTPVTLRGLVAGANVTLQEFDGYVVISSSGSGGATLVDGPNAATSLIFNSMGVLKTVAVQNSVTLDTATSGVLRFGMQLTSAGGGTAVYANAGGQMKTFGNGSGTTLSDVGGLLSY